MCQSSPWSVPISQSYDQNKFQLFLLKKNAFFAWKSLLQNGRNRSAAMWTSDDSYWRQKKNCSYYPEHFRFHFYSFKNDCFLLKIEKIREKHPFFQFFCKKTVIFEIVKMKSKMLWIVWAVFFLALPRVHMKSRQILTGNEAFLTVLFLISFFKNDRKIAFLLIKTIENLF